MNVEVRRFGRHQKRIIVIDGEPYPPAVAAKMLGMKPRTLEKRMDRGSDLTKPVKRYVYE